MHEVPKETVEPCTGHTTSSVSEQTQNIIIFRIDPKLPEGGM